MHTYTNRFIQVNKSQIYKYRNYINIKLYKKMNNNGEELLNTIMERDLGPHCTQNRNTCNFYAVLELWVPDLIGS